MNPSLALLLFTAGIAGLFWLDRDGKVRASAASWLPTIWLLIGGSRNVGEWLAAGVRIDADVAHVDGNPIDKSVLGVLVVLSALVLVSRRQRVLEFVKANASVVAFIAYCAASLVWSDVPMVGFRRWFRMVGDIMMVLVVLTDPAPSVALKSVLKRAAFLLIPVSLMLIRYFPDMGRSYGQDGSLFWTGVATGKNGLGITCFIFGFASVWRVVIAFRDRRRPNRTNELIAHGSVAAISIWLLQLANSMTSSFCFVISTGLFLAMTKSPDGTPARSRAVASPAGGSLAKIAARKPAFVHVVILATVLLAGSVLFLGAGGSVLQTIGRDPTLTGRTEIWQIALGFVRNPWFGEGYESFWTPERIAEMARAHASLTQAHNGYIEVYLNLGLVGIVFLSALIVAGYRKAFSLLRENADAGSIRLVFLVIALIYNCTEGAFKFMTPVWFCFLLGAIRLPSAPVPKDSMASPRRRNGYAVRAGERVWRSA